jgi:Uncharacterized conserved protein
MTHLNNRALITPQLQLDWNYHSNKLERNSLTFTEIEKLLLEGLTAPEKPLKDHLEITGHNEAINWIADLSARNYPITESFIRELHNLMLKSPCEVKTITFDGQLASRWIPMHPYRTSHHDARLAEPNNIAAEMHELIRWYLMMRKEEDADPVRIAAVFHYRFMKISPFTDGNGRTARMLMNFILLSSGFAPCIIPVDERQHYLSLLYETDEGDAEPFARYIASKI